MTKSIFTIILLSSVTLAIGACSTYDSQSPTDRAPGTYKSSQQMTNSNGTDVKTDQTTRVYRDENGDKKASVTTKTTRDPEGLFNKETTNSTKTYE